MLIDYKGSQLFAFGTPKGKFNKKGELHRFWKLWLKVLNKDIGYAGRIFSTYDNYFISEEQIKLLENEIKGESGVVEQEIYGQFIDESVDNVYNKEEFEYFAMKDINTDNIIGRIGAVDVADEGLDALSFPIGCVIGDKIYITDWLFTTANTEYTIPKTISLINDNKIDSVVIETNNHGSVFLKQIKKEVISTQIKGVYQTSQKHSRIIQMSSFIRLFFVFRNDYSVGSDYDRAMSQFFSYRKDSKSKHDDAPDSIALLALHFRQKYAVK